MPRPVWCDDAAIDKAVDEAVDAQKRIIAGFSVPPAIIAAGGAAGSTAMAMPAISYALQAKGRMGMGNELKWTHDLSGQVQIGVRAHGKTPDDALIDLAVSSWREMSGAGRKRFLQALDGKGAHFTPASQPAVRIGTDEREKTIDVLQEHYVKGRITQTEFEERSGAAFRALFQPDLDKLVQDLPAAQEAPTPHTIVIPVRRRPTVPGIAAVATFVMIMIIIVAGVLSHV